MYITIDPKQIKPAINAVHSVAGGKSQMPILQQLYLRAEHDQVMVRASDEMMSLCYRVAATVQASGSLLTPARLFAELIQDFPQAPLTLINPSPTDATAALLRCQKIKANVKRSSMALEEFPTMPAYPDEGQLLLTIDCELLREVVEQVAFAAATHDLSKPVLEGISLKVAEGQACFAGADAFRLALRRIAIPDPCLRAELVVPAHALRTLAHLLPSSGAVIIALTGKGHQLLFHTPTMDVAIRVMAGIFPAYEPLVTASYLTRVVVQTQVLADAVRLSAPFARGQGHRLLLRITPAMSGEAAALVLEAQDPDLGANEVRIDESLRIEGPALTLSVNDQFLTQALAVVSSREVALELRDDRHPIAIKPVSPLDHVSIVTPLLITPASTPTRPAVTRTIGA